MNIANSDKARQLLNELAELKAVSDVCGNYDSKAYAVYTTFHNNNTKTLKEVRIPMPIEVILAMGNHISRRIAEIEKELESL